MPQKQYESQRRWNSENYKQINIAVRPELADAFRTTCEQAHTPMREVFITLMTEYCAKCKACRAKKTRRQGLHCAKQKAKSYSGHP